jgi:hypothetical protein
MCLARAGLDAVKEILHVIDGAVAKGVGLEDGIIFGWYTFATDAKSEAVELCGIGAAKRCS